MSQTMEALEALQKHAADIKAGNVVVAGRQIAPGLPATLHRGLSPNDCIPQGDFYLVVRAVCDTDAETIKQLEALRPKDGYTDGKPVPGMQLVPGNTEGSRHVLESSEGVQMYVPTEWKEETMVGPWFCTTDKPTKVLHPTHGPVTVEPRMVVEIVYQRTMDYARKEARRVRD